MKWVAIAEGDKQALQEAMRATFTRGKKQDFEDTNPDLKDFGLRPGRPITTKPQSSAAQAVLEAAKNRFASGTVLAPESAQGGLTIPTVEAPVAEKKVCLDFCTDRLIPASETTYRRR